MLFLKLFQTEQEKQSCVETQEYISYTEETDTVNIHKEIFFCKLYQANGDIINIEGSGELTSVMTRPYSATTVSVEIGNTCNAIGDSVFFQFVNLTSVTISDNVTSIGSESFYDCRSLSGITIPESVTTIENLAFNGCSGLTSITIPKNVTNLGGRIFYYCSNLTTIISSATTAPTISNTTFRSVGENGTLYVPSGSTGYDTWMGETNYYLGIYNWTKVEI